MTSLRLLIVEDNEADAVLIEELLLDLYEVLEVRHASTISRACEHLADHRPDVVILDLGLPDALDLEGLQMVRDRAPALPVVVLTGHDDSDLAHRALDGGAQDYLVKGTFDAAVLDRTIRYAIDRSRFVERLDSVSRELQDAKVNLGAANEVLRATAEERVRRIYELNTLQQLSAALGATMDIDRVLQELAHCVLSVTHSLSCVVWLRIRDGLKPMSAARMTLDPDMPIISLRKLPTMNRVLSGRTAVLSSVEEGTLRYCPGANGNSHALLVPIRTVTAPIGMLTAWFSSKPALSAADIHLVETVAETAGVAVDNARLYAEREHVTALLRKALLPHTELRHAAVEVGSLYVPSSILSGDYFDLISTGTERFCLVMADIMGKGTDAAIDAVRAKAVIQSQTTAGNSPSKVLQALNLAVSQASPMDTRLISVMYVCVEPALRQATFSCAGHDPALMILPDGGFEMLPKEGDAVTSLIGVSIDSRFEDSTYDMPAGATLLLYTDGVTEARSANGAFYGIEKLHELAEQYRNMHPQQMVDAIYASVRTFTDGMLSDDLSLLAVRLV